MTSLFVRRLGPMLFQKTIKVHPLGGVRTNFTPKEDRVTVSKRLDSFKIDSDAVKNKKTFIEMIENFKTANPTRKGHVEFIIVALQHLEEFQVERDIEVYNALFDLFPKRKMIPKNAIQAEFQHFPRHLDAGIDILHAMNMNSVMPDRNMREQILAVFGPETRVFKKYSRMMYWMPKLKNMSPYRLPAQLPTDPKELALIGMRQMTNVEPSMNVEEFDAADLEDSVDKTWIVSAQSPTQQRLLIEHQREQPLRIEGPFNLWLRKGTISYFTLLGDPVNKPKVEINAEDMSDIRLTMFGEPEIPSRDLRNIPSVHEQEAETIFACCATGTSSRDSLLSWLRFLQKNNPVLERIPVVFQLKAPSNALVDQKEADRQSV